MSLTKKLLIFFISLMTVSINIECMQQRGSLYDQRQIGTDQGVRYSIRSESEQEFKSRPRRQSNFFQRILGYANIGDYLVQLASIYSIDSDKEKVVDALAKLRILFNGLAIYGCAKNLWTLGSNLNENSAKNLKNWGAIIRDVVSGLFRGNNLSKDINIAKNSSALALGNKTRNDKNLNNKKLVQYLWLTLNKVLGWRGFHAMLHNLGTHKVMGNNINFGREAVYCAAILKTISELYRQHLMYKMIENKKQVQS